ncbi:MAG: hypothetical protein ACRC8S_02565 [Fimbriiglobus sp.]
MDISIRLEPIAAGFRASTQTPIPLTKEAETESEAFKALSLAILETIENPNPPKALRVPNMKRLIEITDSMRANPMFEEFEKALAEHRKVANAVEE